MKFKKLTQPQIDFFRQNGYLTVEELLDAGEVDFYLNLYNDFLSGKIDTDGLRSDLSGSAKKKGEEKITQIMRPSTRIETLLEKALHQRSRDLARQLLGEDMEIDFDMLIDKGPHTNAPTPWHQDEAYWLDMPDKRAVSCWVALDESTLENGCMWYVSETHQTDLRKHTQIGNKGALQCQGTEKEATAQPLKPGSCTFHHGRTLHYSRGNSTGSHRRAFIVNFRPEAMIQYERERGYDHLGARKNKS